MDPISFGLEYKKFDIRKVVILKKNSGVRPKALLFRPEF